MFVHRWAISACSFILTGCQTVAEAFSEILSRSFLMKTGIIGLPQVGKTSLFRILTKAHLSDQARANPREAHIGVAKVPDDRLDRLAALYNPKKLTHTSVEYVDVGAIGQEALKDSAYAAHLRNVDALAHVVRVFRGSIGSAHWGNRSAARH